MERLLLSIATGRTFFSFLPLSHTLERTGVLSSGYDRVHGGLFQISGQLAEDLQLIRPTAMIAVPRIFERVYARLKEQIARKSVFARKMFELAVVVGWKRFLCGQRREDGALFFCFGRCSSHWLPPRFLIS